MFRWIKIYLKNFFGCASDEEKIRLKCHKCLGKHVCAYACDAKGSPTLDAEIACGNNLY